MTPSRLAWRALLLVLCAAAAGCDEKPKGEAPSRFAGVTKPTAASANFCEKTWEPGLGPELTLPALRSLPGEAVPKGREQNVWHWVNVWATWCVPCVEEMGLLANWHEALTNDGLNVSFELLSVDEADAEAALKGWLKRPLPGPVRWARSAQDWGPWLETLGISKDSAIPIHALAGPDGKLRCVRVGSLHAQDYGAVKALITSAR